MANQPPTFTPAQQAAIVAFRQKYPDAPRGPSEWATFFPKHPEATQDFVNLQQVLGLTKNGPYQDWHINFQTGQPVHETSKKKFALEAALIVGGTAAAGSAIAAAGGAGGAGAAGAGSAAAGTGAAGTTAAGVGGSSLLHSMLPTLIGAGSNVAGSAIAAKSNNKAAQLQADAADKALALQKEQYDLQRSDNAPYRALGVGGVNNLAYLSGIEMPPPAPAAAPPSAPATGTPSAPSLSTLGSYGQPQATQGAFVSMQAPHNGQVYQVPADRVAEAEAQGGKRISA